jgi:hypothetical protein
MSAGAVQSRDAGSDWPISRRLYPLYVALADHFSLDVGHCAELESPVDRPDPQVLQTVDNWFADVDRRVHVWQLRQFLQSSGLATDDALRALLHRHLHRNPHEPSDREKLDFLLVQYFAQAAPVAFYRGELSLSDVADVLEPVLGYVSADTPDWLQPLDALFEEFCRCRTLKEVFTVRLLERIQQVKNCGDRCYDPAALLVFTRFNFLVRREFVRALQNELDYLRHALGKLETAGIENLDCSSAGLGAVEPVSRLRLKINEWRKLFRAEYSAGGAFQQLLKIRAVIEDALRQSTGNAIDPEALDMPTAPAGELSVHTSPVTPRPRSVDVPTSGKMPSRAAPPRVQVAAFEETSTEPGLMDNQGSVIGIAEFPSPEQTRQHGPEDMKARLEAFLDKLAGQLILETRQRGAAVTVVVVEDTRLVLSSWEVAAFLNASDEVSEFLRRAVGARGLLIQAMEKHKRAAGDGNLAQVLRLGHSEAAALQERVARARETRDIDTSVNLAATNKRLSVLLEESRKLLK